MSWRGMAYIVEQWSGAVAATRTFCSDCLRMSFVGVLSCLDLAGNIGKNKSK